MHSALLRRPLQILAFAAMATLTACAQPFQARVESFQAMPPAAGQTFALQAADSSRVGSLEFSAYANLVAVELQKHGLRPVANGPADLEVQVDFGQGPARERLASRPSTFSSGFGWGGPRWGGFGWSGYPGWYSPFYSPFYSPWGMGGMWDQELYSYTVYPAYLHVQIRRAADKVGVFEGRAEATTRSNDLPSVMPKLVTALFTDFPGQSAVSKIVKVPDKR